MSRYRKDIDDDKYLVYGCDHALGYFYEIRDKNEEIPIEEGDQVLENTPRGEILDVLEKYDVKPDHFYSVFYNLPF